MVREMSLGQLLGNSLAPSDQYVSSKKASNDVNSKPIGSMVDDLVPDGSTYMPVYSVYVGELGKENGNFGLCLSAVTSTRRDCSVRIEPLILTSEGTWESIKRFKCPCSSVAHVMFTYDQIN